MTTITSLKRNPPTPPRATVTNRRPRQSDLNRVLNSTRTQAGRLAEKVSKGSLTAEQFADAMDAMLLKKHTRAAVLGRWRAGDFSPQEADDVTFASLVMDGESEYLSKFARDIHLGRYTGNAEALRKRAEMYASRVAGTANETFTLASSMYEFTWKLGAAEEHCTDCPELAANSPYQWDSLPTVPKANATACKINCKCYLLRSDGIRGFSA